MFQANTIVNFNVFFEHILEVINHNYYSFVSDNTRTTSRLNIPSSFKICVLYEKNLIESSVLK